MCSYFCKAQVIGMSGLISFVLEVAHAVIESRRLKAFNPNLTYPLKIFQIKLYFISVLHKLTNGDINGRPKQKARNSFTEKYTRFDFYEKCMYLAKSNIYV